MPGASFDAPAAQEPSSSGGFGMSLRHHDDESREGEREQHGLDQHKPACGLQEADGSMIPAAADELASTWACNPLVRRKTPRQAPHSSPTIKSPCALQDQHQLGSWHIFSVGKRHNGGAEGGPPVSRPLNVG